MLPDPEQRLNYPRPSSGLSTELVNEFIVRYEEHFKEKLTYGQAEVMFERLIGLYRLLGDLKQRQDEQPVAPPELE